LVLFAAAAASAVGAAALSVMLLPACLAAFQEGLVGWKQETLCV
jgi:hypothetical protein